MSHEYRRRQNTNKGQESTLQHAARTTGDSQVLRLRAVLGFVGRKPWLGVVYYDVPHTSSSSTQKRDDDKADKE